MILYLDTRGPENRIALFSDGKQISELVIEQRQLSEQLDLSIRELLSRQKLSVKDLTAVVVHRGPGSFTGLRIGLSYANGLALGLGIPLKGLENDREIFNLKEPLENHMLPVLPIYDSEPTVTQPKSSSS